VLQISTSVLHQEVHAQADSFFNLQGCAIPAITPVRRATDSYDQRRQHKPNVYTQTY
jgi:hypothetical protein